MRKMKFPQERLHFSKIYSLIWIVLAILMQFIKQFSQLLELRLVAKFCPYPRKAEPKLLEDRATEISCLITAQQPVSSPF